MNRERLTRLVCQRTAGLTLYARQWLDALAAEDVVQEALAALLMERHEPDEPMAWMFRAVRNASIDTLRAESRRKRREQAVASERDDWFESRAEALMDARAAEEALRGISPLQREIVVMRIWGDLGFAQMAEILRVSVSTVHERYEAALQELRMKLEKPCEKKME